MFASLAVLAIALVPAFAAPLEGFVARQTSGGYQLHPNGDLTRCLSAATSVVAGEPGARVTIDACDGARPQTWALTSGETSVKYTGANSCITAGGLANGARLYLEACIPKQATQTFYYTTDLRLAVENQGLCVDLPSGDKTPGNALQIWQCTDGNTNQIWSQ
ncbi:carbohydrate-binding module family 13 protein [Schizophyllum fasciatum]